MEEYYRLTSIRHSAYMAMPYGDTEFHSGEFGNELERFLYRYDLLKAKTESIERMLPQNQKDGFFEVVKYPIFLAAFSSRKELEAQEARHIARPGLFNKDDEAKASSGCEHRCLQQTEAAQCLLQSHQETANGRISSLPTVQRCRLRRFRAHCRLPTSSG